MTPLERCVARCTAAKLHVLGAAYVGAQICVMCKPFGVTPETVIKRLGVPVTVSYGDGTGAVQLFFAAEEQP